MTTTNLHEIEEREFGMGPRLWDATPGVCCAAFQLGACCHTEGFDQDDVDDAVALDAVRLAAIAKVHARQDARDVAVDVCFRCGGELAFDESAEVYRLTADPDAIFCGDGTDSHDPEPF